MTSRKFFHFSTEFIEVSAGQIACLTVGRGGVNFQIFIGIDFGVVEFNDPGRFGNE